MRTIILITNQIILVYTKLIREKLGQRAHQEVEQATFVFRYFLEINLFFIFAVVVLS